MHRAIASAGLLLAGIISCLCRVSAPAVESLPDGFTDVVAASGLVYPTAMAAVPDGRLFICQQWGKVRVFKDGALLPNELIAVPADGTGDRGLLGITVDPDFASNHFVYLFYTEKPASSANDYVRNRVSRITVDGDVAVPGSEVMLIESDLVYTVFHNGGPLHFGPDGKLYIGLGDGEEGASAQRMTSLLGKILRINSDGTIPADNPFVATTTGKYRAIWALGLRDPFSFAFQPGTGRMLIGDVGQNTSEEIDQGAPGANFGWPNVEGAAGQPAYADPLYAYHHGNAFPDGDCIAGCCFSDAAVPAFPPSYAGLYFFLDYSKGWIGTLDPDHGNAVAPFVTGLTGPVGLTRGADGDLYYLTYNYNDPASTLHRISFVAAAPAVTSVTADSPVSAGASATFTVEATGTRPFTWQWQRDGSDIPGATGASYTIAHVAAADDGAAFVAVVTNAYGSAASSPVTLTVSSDQPPVCSITAPAAGDRYAAGDTIAFSGVASDPEDGDLAASAYQWRVDLITSDDPVSVIPPTSGMTSGSFTVPTHGDPRTDVVYRVTLTVTDSAGRQGSASVDIAPRTAQVTVTTLPAGMSVVLGGFSQRTTPFTVPAVVGQQLELAAMDPQVLDGADYAFVSWSDAGAGTHSVVVPTADSTWTATFAAADPAGSGGSSGSGVSGGSGTGSDAGSSTASTGAGVSTSTASGSASGGCGLGGMLALITGALAGAAGRGRRRS